MAEQDSTEKYLKNVKLYQEVFNSESGQQVLWDMMKASGFVGHGFDKDPYTTAYNCGLKASVARVLQIIEMDEKQLRDMVEKQRKAEKEYEW